MEAITGTCKGGQRRDRSGLGGEKLNRAAAGTNFCVDWEPDNFQSAQQLVASLLSRSGDIRDEYGVGYTVPKS